MADLVATRFTSLAPDDVLVRAVQFFTNESWRAQSQTNRVATFVGVPKLPCFQLAVAIALTFCLVVPGLIYYFFVIRGLRRLQNVVVTATSKEPGCDVVVSYPPHAQSLVDAYFAALPGGAPREDVRFCTGCGKEIAQGANFCVSCGGAPFASTPRLPPG